MKHIFLFNITRDKYWQALIPSQYKDIKKLLHF